MVTHWVRTAGGHGGEHETLPGLGQWFPACLHRQTLFQCQKRLEPHMLLFDF